eukprot:Nk52_evm6s2209 gene=Nk52_evmTU6s2209
MDLSMDLLKDVRQVLQENRKNLKLSTCSTSKAWSKKAAPTTSRTWVDPRLSHFVSKPISLNEKGLLTLEQKISKANYLSPQDANALREWLLNLSENINLRIDVANCMQDSLHLILSNVKREAALRSPELNKEVNGMKCSSSFLLWESENAMSEFDRIQKKLESLVSQATTFNYEGIGLATSSLIKGVETDMEALRPSLEEHQALLSLNLIANEDAEVTQMASKEEFSFFAKYALNENFAFEYPFQYAIDVTPPINGLEDIMALKSERLLTLYKELVLPYDDSIAKYQENLFQTTATQDTMNLRMNEDDFDNVYFDDGGVGHFDEVAVRESRVKLPPKSANTKCETRTPIRFFFNPFVCWKVTELSKYLENEQIPKHKRVKVTQTKMEEQTPTEVESPKSPQVALEFDFQPNFELLDARKLVVSEALQRNIMYNDFADFITCASEKIERQHVSQAESQQYASEGSLQEIELYEPFQGENGMMQEGGLSPGWSQEQVLCVRQEEDVDAALDQAISKMESFSLSDISSDGSKILAFSLLLQKISKFNLHVDDIEGGSEISRTALIESNQNGECMINFVVQKSAPSLHCVSPEE